MGQKKQTTEFERKCFEAAGISIVYHICHRLRDIRSRNVHDLGMQ